MISPSLRHKIEQQRLAAQHELPKARLCGQVVLALLAGQSDLDAAVAALKEGLGNTWHIVMAFQFMSGRQALFAAECAANAERANLVLAHRIAEAVSPITKLDLAHLRAMCVTSAAELRLRAN